MEDQKDLVEEETEEGEISECLEGVVKTIHQNNYRKNDQNKLINKDDNHANKNIENLCIIIRKEEIDEKPLERDVDVLKTLKILQN